MKTHGPPSLLLHARALIGVRLRPFLRPTLRSMRARTTAQFALFVAILMIAGGTILQKREVRRAERMSNEVLSVAVERARDEMDSDDDGIANRAPLEVVRHDSSEIGAGGLALLVAQGDRVLWQSPGRVPMWPHPGARWRIQTVSQGGQTLVIARDWTPFAEDLGEKARALWIWGAFVVAATTLAAWVVVGKTLSPLDQLAAQAATSSQEELAVRLKSPSSDAEMQHLTRTLNGLLERQQKEAQTRGRFYAAASHELRTPIQVLLGEIDVALGRVRSVPEYIEVLTELQSETERLETLVGDLLRLNALEMRQNQAPRERFDLACGVERVLLQLAVSVDERDLGVEPCLRRVEIEAPPAHVEVLVRNLLENAIKYAAPASTLRVATEAEAGGGVLWIWNACQAPVEGLENWFEPFYRPDASRDSETGGNGLGLSIVAALARANDWDVKLCESQGGVLARVWFESSAGAGLPSTSNL